MTVIEKVARAMFASLENGGADEHSLVGSDYNLSNVMIDGYVDLPALARAALEALREPSMGMKLAGADKITAQMTGSGPPADYDAACDAWQAMLTAALNEPAS